MKHSEISILFLTTVHNYPDPRIISKELYSLKEKYANLFYMGQHTAKESFSENGVKVIPLKIVKSRFGRIIQLQNEAYKKIKKIKPNIIHFHDPELITLMWFIQKKLNCKIIFDVHESVAESLKDKQWLPKILRKFFPNLYTFFEKRFIKNFDYIIVVKESFLDIYGNKAIVIKNYPDIHLSQFNSKKDFSGHLNLVYAGVITEDRGIFIILNVFKKLLEYNMDISLTLIGRVDSFKLEEQIIEFIKKNNLEKKIILTGQLTIFEVYKILSKSHFGFSLLKPTISYKNAISTKIFDYMANKMAYVVSDFEIYKKYTLESNTGITVNYNDTREIVEKISEVFDNRNRLERLARNGFKMVSTKWNWNNEKEKLLKLYEKI